MKRKFSNKIEIYQENTTTTLKRNKSIGHIIEAKISSVQIMNALTLINRATIFAVA